MKTDKTRLKVDMAYLNEDQPFRQGWENEIDDMLRNHPGVLVQVEVSESAWIHKHCKSEMVPAEITVGPWEKTDGTKWLFSNEYGPACQNYPLGKSGYFLETDMDRRIGTPGSMPPHHLADFLGVDCLLRMPRIFYPYLPREWLIHDHPDDAP
jgi:hypothetical protein